MTVYTLLFQNFVQNSCTVRDQGTLDELWTIFNSERQQVHDSMDTAEQGSHVNAAGDSCHEVKAEGRVAADRLIAGTHCEEGKELQKTKRRKAKKAETLDYEEDLCVQEKRTKKAETNVETPGGEVDGEATAEKKKLKKGGKKKHREEQPLSLREDLDTESVGQQDGRTSRRKTMKKNLDTGSVGVEVEGQQNGETIFSKPKKKRQVEELERDFGEGKKKKPKLAEEVPHEHSKHKKKHRSK